MNQFIFDDLDFGTTLITISSNSDIYLTVRNRKIRLDFDSFFNSFGPFLGLDEYVLRLTVLKNEKSKKIISTIGNKMKVSVFSPLV